MASLPLVSSSLALHADACFKKCLKLCVCVCVCLDLMCFLPSIQCWLEATAWSIFRPVGSVISVSVEGATKSHENNHQQFHRNGF